MKGHASPIRDEAHWHELRRTHIGGSECAALLNEHPFLTKYELWHRKRGILPERDYSDNDRVFFGRILEPAIAEGVRQKTGWTIRKVKRYYSMCPALAWGGTLDYEIIQHERGAGILEIKTVDSFQFKQWDGVPPLAYELQAQSYIALTGRAWACLAVLIGGNRLELFTYERRPRTITILKDAVAAFWESIEANTAPAPNYALDHETISQLYSATDAGKFTDMTGNNRLAELLDEYDTAAGARRKYERESKALRAELLMTIGDAEEVRCGDWRLRATAIAGTSGKVITQDMVGRELRGREGYRALHVARRQEDAA